MTQLLADGSGDFGGGQDSSVVPDLIPANCYAAGVNVSVRSACIQPRWGFERKTLKFQDGGLENSFKKVRSFQNIFESGKFQAFIPHSVTRNTYIIYVISGRLFTVDIESLEVTYIPIADGSTLNTRASRINWADAGQYIIFFDYPAYPVILDGLIARRANPANDEVPVSTNGAYNQNRLFITNAGTEFTGGDAFGNIATPDAPITFKEVLTPGSTYYGQIFNLPTNVTNAAITFMGFLQFSDSSTGIGPLICGTSNAVYTFGTHNPRSAWANGPFGSLLCYNSGVAGQRAWANVNSDAFFLGTDGFVRSVSMARTEQKQWARIPVSREVEKWFKFWDKSLIKFGFVGYFKNKIFFSVNPYRTQAVDYDTMFPIADYTHGGMVVLELDNLSSFGTPSKPIWAGLWTGVNPMDMCIVNDRAFIASKDGGVNKLYEINPDICYDTADDTIRQVRSRVYTRQYNFTDSFLNKGLHSVDLNLDSLQGDFKVDVSYKPSHSPCFLPLGVRTHAAPWRTNMFPSECFLNGYAPHIIRDFSIGDPQEDQAGNPVTQDLYRVFKKVQLMLTFWGIYWELRELRVKALPELEPDTLTQCEEYPKVDVCNCPSDDWDVESFGGCDRLET